MLCVGSNAFSQLGIPEVKGHTAIPVGISSLSKNCHIFDFLKN